MAANRAVQNFVELRNGLDGIGEFIDAARQFMDDFGIAPSRGKRVPKGASNGTNGHEPTPNVAALKRKAREMFGERRGPYKRKAGSRGQYRKLTTKERAAQQKARDAVAEPDGKHVTINEAARMLRMSDANIRIMAQDGRLPAPTYEYRPWSKKEPDRKKIVQVIPKASVDDYKKAAAKAE